MKWIYGRQDWKTLERGLENCYLFNERSGRFFFAYDDRSCGKNDHSVFMACTKAPNHRVNVIHRIKEELDIGETKYVLSTQELRMERKKKDTAILQNFLLKFFLRGVI
mgnify:CR=1 FL=1